MPMTPEDKEWFKDCLAEGIHTAFRKASDHSSAHAIWKLIRTLPGGAWDNIVNFVANAMIDGLEHREKSKTGS